MPRLVSSRAFDDGNDRWEIVDAPPSAALAGIVDRYAWWSEHTHSFATRRELAATTGVVIVNLGAPLEIIDARGDLLVLQAGEGFVGGMAQATSLSRSTGAMAGIHIHLSPPNIARMLGVPMAEIADRVVKFDELAGPAARELGQRLAEGRNHDARWALLDRFVIERLNDAPPDDRETTHAMVRLAHGHRVQSVADDLGWSRKRLAQRFRDATGLHPRAFAGLARFERFSAMLQAAPATPLAETAVAVGYADQAHLTREVVRYAALTPGELRARLIPGGGGVRA